MQNNSFSLRKIITVGILVLILFSAVFIYISTRLHIVKSTPDPSRYPSSLSVVVFEFNQKLDKAAIEKRFKTDPKSIVTFDFESSSTILVSDKTLRINIASTPVPGKHSISLANITSESGESFSQKMAMNIVNTPYKNMSDDEKKLFDEAATEGDELPNDPIVSVLPHETDKYKMTYTFPPEDVELPATITITMKFFEPGDVALPATEAEKNTYLQDIRKYRKEALAYLESKGINLAKYVLTYTESDLRSEFPAGYTPKAEVGE
jgi:hypothetical protein